MNLRQLFQHRYFVTWTLAIGLGLRLLFLLVFQSEAVSDFADYHELAASIAAGEGYVVNGVETAFRPVGWPALLGGVYGVLGTNLLVGKLFMLLMSMCLLWLSYILGKKLSGKEEVGRLVLLLMAVHPNGIAYSQLLSAEVPFLLLVLGGVLLMNKKSDWRVFALAGILFGMATLVKSQGLFLPLIFGVVFYLNGEAERWRGWLNRIGLVYLFVGVTLTPWLVRNYLVFDSFPTLVTNGSANLLVGNNPFANGKYKWGDQEIAWYAAHAPQASGEIAHANKARDLAIQYIQENPGETLSRIPKKLWYTYAHDYEGLDWLRESCGGLSGWRHRLMQAFKALGQLLYLTVIVIVLRSWFFVFSRSNRSTARLSEMKNGKRETKIRYLLGLLILYFTIIVLLIFGDGRFHFPLIPFLFLLTAVQLFRNNSPEPPNELAQA